MLGGISIQTIINKISIAVILLVVVLVMVDKLLLGGISLISLALVNNYISKLEKEAEIDKKVKIISWICFFAIVIIGLVLILSFPKMFNTYGF